MSIKVVDLFLKILKRLWQIICRYAAHAKGQDTQKGRRDRKSIKDQLPATLGQVDYMGKRLYQMD